MRKPVPMIDSDSEEDSRSSNPRKRNVDLEDSFDEDDGFENAGTEAPQEAEFSSIESSEDMTSDSMSGNVDQKKIANLYEILLQMPSLVKTTGKDIAELLKAYENEQLGTREEIFEHEISSQLAHCIGLALTRREMPAGTWQIILRATAFADAFEASFGTSVCKRVVETVVAESVLDMRPHVRERVCSLMRECLELERDRAEGEEEADEPMDVTQASEKDSFDAMDEDEDDFIDLQSLRPKPVPLSTQSGTFSNQDRARIWGPWLALLTRDKVQSVRLSALRAILSMPHVQIDAPDYGKTVYPRDIICRTLSDKNDEIRQLIAENMKFDSPEAVDMAVDALDGETNRAIINCLVRRLELGVAFHDLRQEQVTRLLEVVFAPDANPVRIPGLFSKWLAELAEGEPLRLSMLFEFVCPIEHKAIAHKAFDAIAVVCRKESVESESSGEWVAALRAEDTATIQDGVIFDEMRIQKEFFFEALQSGVQEPQVLAKRLFLHRRLIEFLIQTQPKKSTEDVLERFLPTLTTLATATQKFVNEMYHMDVEEDQALIEFIFSELCTMLRMVDRSDGQGLELWREVVTSIAVQNGFFKTSGAIFQAAFDIVVRSTRSKEEALNMANEFAYSVLALIPRKGFGGDEELILRCALLCEALIRIRFKQPHTAVVENLIRQLGEKATSESRRTRPIGCRIVAMAACICDKSLLTWSPILVALPDEMSDEPETLVACLTGITELVLSRRLKKAACAMFGTPEDTSQEAEVHVKALASFYEKWILCKDPVVRRAAIHQALRLLIVLGQRWTSFLAKILLAAHATNAEPELLEMVKQFLADHDTLSLKMYISASVVAAVDVAETVDLPFRVGFNAMIEFALAQAKHAVLDGKPEYLINAPEISIIIGLLHHLRNYPDTTLSGTISAYVTHYVSVPVLRRYRKTEVWQILSTAKRTHKAVSPYSDQSVIAPLARWIQKLQNFLNPHSPASKRRAMTPSVPAKNWGGVLRARPADAPTSDETEPSSSSPPSKVVTFDSDSPSRASPSSSTYSP
ncbi:unnamed protein product, partial [Mesorhabditis spiculigera]